MNCEHGYIGACAECDGMGQIPEPLDLPRYELRYDDDNPGIVEWSGGKRPTQAQIDRVAVGMTARGWNGTQLDLYRDGQWVEWVSPSDEALA